MGFQASADDANHDGLRGAALRFATAKHWGQTRKYTGDPYILHPTAVANIVRTVPECTDEMIAAAYLHDVVEDCGVRIEEIEHHFGSKVSNLVFFLTDASKGLKMKRSIRKEIDRVMFGFASPEAKTIKLADLIDNTESIKLHDPSFYRVYHQEKRDLLPFLRRGNQQLFMRACQQLE